MIPYQPRRLAPWRGIHVLSALVVYLALAQITIAAFHSAGIAKSAAAPLREAQRRAPH